MATYTSFFPGNVYPQDYNPAINGFDYNAMFGELVDMGQATQTANTTTKLNFDLVNGLKMVISGTGFAFEDDGASAGKISKIEVFQSDGTSKVLSMALSRVSLVSFEEAAADFGPWGLGGWLLNKNDTLNGSAGDDDLEGFAGNDKLSGKAGDDFLVGGEGKDRYDGGTGFDTVNFSDARDGHDALGGIVLDATKHTVVDPWGNTETFKNIEGWRGTQFSDVMKGSSLDENFQGLGGRDTIDGKRGFDMVSFHRDANNGGAGIGITANLDEGFAIDGFGKTDKMKNIEGVRGTDFDDTLVGSDAGNFLRGDGGSDMMTGGAGSDTFQFNSGFGEDTITDFDANGGAGNQDFIRGNFDDATVTQDGDDTVLDFGNGDVLTLLDVSAADISAEDFV